MTHLLRLAFCVALVLSASGVNAYGAVSLAGDGGITFDGTGQLVTQQFPNLIIERYSSNCTPSVTPGFIVICHEPLDMSLLGNDIVRAENVRIAVSLHDLRIGVFLTFGCPTCATSVVVDDETDLVSISPGVWTLSDATAQALQALIDEHGAMSIFMSIGLNGGSIQVFSSVQAVTMDIKPGAVNLRSRGVVPVAILTTDDFDATSIEVTSLRFGASGKEAAAARAVLADVDNDGDTDLLVFFRIQDTGIDCETLFTYISGVTTTGVSIAGTDSVAIVGCH